MTVHADSGVSALQARFGRALASRLGPHIERLDWNPQQLADHQRRQLRALLATALRSPFHARRLAGIDPDRFELGQLSELPVMSKAQMMDGFDELLTDRRLTRARAERQLAASAQQAGLLDDRYVCLASGAARGRGDCSCRRSRSTPSSRRRSRAGPSRGSRRPAGRPPTACRW
jgi:phenylacetate-CoA ligase